MRGLRGLSHAQGAWEGGRVMQRPGATVHTPRVTLEGVWAANEVPLGQAF